MPWIYNEDAALKFKLQGLTVQDANNPARPVPVRYRLPEDELASLTYPIIIIEHMPISFAPERQSRAYTTLDYAPDGFPIWWDPAALHYDTSASPYLSDWPLAVNLDYKVTVYTRKMAEHLQPLMTQLALQPYLPFQFGFLNIPQDGTIRNMFLLQGPTIEYGKDNDDKRLFRSSYMLRVMSEVIPHVDVIGVFSGIVTDINLDLGVYSDVTNLTTELVASNRAIISTGPKIGFNVGVVGSPSHFGQTEPEAEQSIARRRPSRGTYTR